MSDKILWKQEDVDGAIGRLVLNGNERYRPGYVLEVGYQSMVCTMELERAHLAGLWLALLEEADSLEWVTKALARETVIRHMVAETGEPREIVAEMVDAHASMDQEAVLDLTEGEPTTLRAALERYVDDLDPGDENLRVGSVIDDLSAILAYPFPEEAKR